MPFRDGTGPSGQGSRTGRGAGNCTGKGGAGRFGGRGLGLERAGELVSCLGVAPDQERSWLEAALQSIAERLDELKDK